MKNIDKKAWSNKSEHLNATIELAIGMEVKDVNGYKGIVVKIIPPTEDFHGTILIWQSDKFDYGSDNCEHYTANNWRSFLRLTDMNLYPKVNKNKL